MRPSPSFEAAAKRVRQIIHTKSIVHVPSLFNLPDEYGPNVFPSLEAVTLSHSGCLVPSLWITSQRIQRVSISLSFSRKENATHVADWNDAVAGYFRQLRLCAPHFHSLQVRGTMSDALNATVASLDQLKSLTIQGSRFLACSTLAAIAAFPALRTLEVHADHIRAEEFEDALSHLPEDAPCFPALEELTIRTTSSLLSALIARLPVGVLKKLHLDIVTDGMDTRGPGAYMKPIFELVAQKASGSLRDILIDDRTEHGPSVDPAAANVGAGDATHTGLSRGGYTLDVLAPLARPPLYNKASHA